MRDIHILVVGPIPSKFGSRNHGGVSAHTWLHAKLLAERGYSVTLLALGTYFGSSFERLSVSVIGLPRLSLGWGFLAFYTAIKTSFKVKDFRKSAILNRFFTKYKLRDIDLKKFDIIHVQSIHGQFQAVVDANLPAKKVLTVHSYDDVLSTSGRARDRLIRKHRVAKYWFDEVIHVSQTDQKKCAALRLNDIKGMVIHNPVEVLNLKHVDKDIDILFVGGLTRRKRPELVLQGAQSLGSKVSCMIVGNGPLLQKLQRDYGEIAVFCGFINHDEVLKLMARARVLCVPSVSESFGLVYVEAALNGAAVIGYKDTISEISVAAELSERERLYFVGFDPDEGDPKVMADTLKFILDSDDSDNLQTSAEITSKLSSQFSGDAYIEKIRQCYGIRSNE